MRRSHEGRHLDIAVLIDDAFGGVTVPTREEIGVRRQLGDQQSPARDGRGTR
jgi:hypothetical protein